MTDIALIQHHHRFDIAIDNGDLLIDIGLRTAVVLSLFIDRRADDDDVIPDGTNNKRGWWGDEFMERPIGSKLWLLKRAKKTNATLQRAREYCIAALQWLIDDGIANSLDVNTHFSQNALRIAVNIQRDNDNQPWQAAWDYELNRV